MTAHSKCERCGVWLEAISVMRHVCTPAEDKPVAYMQTYYDKFGKAFHTFTNQPVHGDDEPLYIRTKEKE